MFMTGLSVTFVARGHVRLDQPLVWSDAAATVSVPAGFRSDGVTAPPWSWPMIGHPYSGSLLRAAVLHDYEIVTRRDTWRNVHRRFYDALRADGVGRFRAGLLYLAVRLGGPRW